MRNLFNLGGKEQDKPLATTEWAFDPEHTRIAFSVKHLGFSISHGYFEEFEGAVFYDEDKPEETGITVTIDTDSVKTISSGLNRHLQSADFFNVDQYPQMVFKSHDFDKGWASKGEVKGELTLLGETHPVKLDVEIFKHEESPMTQVDTIGFRAETTIKRSDWGMTFLSPNVGEEVKVVIDGELMKRAENTDQYSTPERREIPNTAVTHQTHSDITMGGKKVKVSGHESKIGDKGKNFTAVKTDLSEFTLKDAEKKIKLFSVVPSLDTQVCAVQTKRFDKEAVSLKDVAFYTISTDLPFAQERFQREHELVNTCFLSDSKELEFGKKYGFLIDDLRLLCRGIVVLDGKNKIRHVEYVEEVTNEPDYVAALEAVRSILEE